MTIIKLSHSPCDCGGEYFDKDFERRVRHLDRSNHVSWDYAVDEKRHKFQCLLCGDYKFTEWVEVPFQSGFSIDLAQWRR